MEFIFEFILELVLEGGIEASKNSKIPKFVRYPLIVVISLFFIAVIGIIFLAGILSLRENILLGILLISLGLFMLIMSVIKFRMTYLIKTKSNTNSD